MSELLGLIPSSIFSELAVETQVDHQVKKLEGEIIFKLILFSMLHSDKLSLRVMESFLSSAKFRHFTDKEPVNSKYNSIRDRICTIKESYFEGLYQQIFSIYNKYLGEENALSKSDSSYVGIASKLLVNGIRNGGEDKRFVKYSINLKGSLPSSVSVFTAQSFVSDDLALSQLLKEDKAIKNNVVVYDRGLQSRQAFDDFTEDKKWFVTRANPKTRLILIKENEITQKPAQSTVTIKQDSSGYLLSRKGQKTEVQYRVIRGVIDSTQEPICFITNMLEVDAYQAAAWYKQRWEIEVFFKFIKQQLNVKHLVSRDENGIKVMIYMTMILSTLIIVFKKINKISSFKIAKLQLAIELENEMVKAIVMLCGGNPDLAKKLWNST